MRTDDQRWAEWQACLLTRLREAAGHALALDEEPAEQVHTLRKNTKELRALLRLAPDRRSARAKREARRLRRLAQRFAPSRDAQALRDALDDLGATELALPEAPPLAPDDLARAARRFERCARAVEGWELEPADFIEALVRSYRRARRRCPRRLGAASAEALHRLRRACICLSHQLTLVPSARTITRHLERLRRALGHHHDLALLRAWVRETKPPRQKSLLRAITSAQRQHARAAARHASQAFSLRPRELRRRLQ